MTACSNQRCVAIEQSMSRAHRKVAATRKVVEEFWAHKDAANAHSHATAWAAHVALVQLEAILRRGGADDALIDQLLEPAPVEGRTGRDEG